MRTPCHRASGSQGTVDLFRKHLEGLDRPNPDTMTSRSEPDELVGSPDLDQARLSSHALVAELGQAALDGVPAGTLVGPASRVVCDALGLERSMILLRDRASGQLELGAAHGWPDEMELERTIMTTARFHESAISSEKPVVSDVVGSSQGPLRSLSKERSDVLSVRIPGRASPFGIISVFAPDRRGFPPDAGDFIRSIANILGAKLQSEASTRAQRRHIRFQAALAECAQALLVHSEENPLEQAARALLSATDAESVFIERNVMHPEMGFCSQTVAEADRPGMSASKADAGSDYWDVTPWEQMPTSRAHLERGEPFFLVPSELTGVEYDLYEADPFHTKSELDIPIFVRGEWVGLIAFSESEVAREWEDQDLMLLKAAALMVGAYWEAEVTNEELKSLIASKDQLIASVSHELRTPLTSVVGFAKLLEIEGSDLAVDERAMVIRTIAEEGVDLANIIDDLLVAAKAESGTLELVSVPIDLRAQAAQVVEACRPEDVQRILVSDHAVRAEGDPARVRQILRNLISNAIRYGGDSIRVEFAGDADWSTVRVVDDGPGIPVEKRDRVFESYYRGEEDPGLAGSMGLGLSISRQLAERMGGQLSYGYLDHESVFELRLPRID